MTDRIDELAFDAGIQQHRRCDHANPELDGWIVTQEKLDKFAKSIVFDFLSELTNDDDLGPARIKTIQRLAQKWRVANEPKDP